MRALAASVVALAAAACGGLDNRPLEVGSVVGTVTGCDPSVAVVGVLGDVAVKSSADASCVFRIDGLPPGEHQLFVLASSKAVALVDTQVTAAHVSTLGSVATANGAFVHVRVSAPSHQKIAGGLTAPDVPLTATTLGNSGMDRIGPFPAGCFRIEVSAAGLGTQALSECLGGSDLDADVAFSAPDGTKGHEGCAVSGCESGYTCDATSGDCR